MDINWLSYLMRIIALPLELILMYWMDESGHYLICKKSISLLGSNNDGIVNESSDSHFDGLSNSSGVPELDSTSTCISHDSAPIGLSIHLSSSNDNVGGSFWPLALCYCIIVSATFLLWGVPSHHSNPLFLWFHISLWMQCLLPSLLLTSKINLYISQFCCWARALVL